MAYDTEVFVIIVSRFTGMNVNLENTVGSTDVDYQLSVCLISCVRC